MCHMFFYLRNFIQTCLLFPSTAIVLDTFYGIKNVCSKFLERFKSSSSIRQRTRMLQKNKGSSWLNAEPNFEKLKSILCTKSNVTYTNFLTSNILTICKFEGRRVPPPANTNSMICALPTWLQRKYIILKSLNEWWQMMGRTKSMLLYRA